MKAVIYCRVSSKEQVEGTSLESQEAACREYALRNSLSVDRAFIERGESAKYADRTQLLEMMAYCANRANEITVLLVWKVDRLARNVGDHFTIKAALLKHGVRVVSVTEPIDARPEGKLLETILAGFAQFDNDIRAARTLQGMRKKISDGIFPWKPPLGYKSVNHAGKKKTQPDIPDHPVFGLLQQAWKDFATGAYSKAEIRRAITSRGLRAHSGKPISAQTLDKIFTDVFYAGMIHDPWSGEAVPGRHLPMVTTATFEAVQHVIRRRNRSLPHRAIRADFPLRGLVRCPDCHLTLTGSFSRGRSKYYPYYHCRNRACISRANCRLGEVHAEFSMFLRGLSIDQHVIEHIKQYIRHLADNWASLEGALQEKKRLERAHVDSQLQELVRMKMEQLLTDSEYRSHREAALARLSDLGAPAASEAPDFNSLFSDLDEISAPMMNLDDTWQQLPFDFQRRFQQLILPAGYSFGSIGTAQKGRIFSFISTVATKNTIEVAPAGEISNQLIDEIYRFARIIEEAG